MRRYTNYISRYISGRGTRSLPHNAPTFMIVGAQKAGTTALYSYLSQHSSIKATTPKELHFFNCENKYSLGLDFYHSLFPEVSKNQLTFDSSAGYLCNMHAAKRIFDYNSKIKIIVLIRDPVERAYSAWAMYTGFYKRNKNWFFEEWLPNCNTPNSNYIKRSEFALFDFKDFILEEFDVQPTLGDALIEAPILPHGYYYDQLSRFYSYFPEKQILIIETSELRKNTVSILQRIEKFLGLPSYDWLNANLSPVFEGNQASFDPEEEIFQKLSEHYAPHTEKLFKLLGNRYSWHSLKD